jgi:serine/threonine protein kinase
VTTLTKAGRYDLREELGRGAMGVVFHGFDPMIGRDVAVKTLRLSEAGTGLTREELIGRFQTEARAAGLLTHPNIVVVFDAGEEGGLFYITMEFVEGRSLQSLIDAHQPFPVPRVLKLMEQVCSALDFAHQHNVVHRDIKPANLMLTPDDTVKITDFGTAKILQFGTAQTAHVMGTPSYMSPEQVKGTPVDGRSDIFSLGVILYELMTGEKPFPGQNITTVIYKIINEEPIPPRSLDSSIHPGLSAVISRALAKDPNARYQSCHELLNALKNYHEIVSPEATVRMAPVSAQTSQGASHSGHGGTQPHSPRMSGGPTAATPHDSGPSPQFMLPVGLQEGPPKKRGGVLLTLILLGIIGYSGYRIYPPLLDLWQRAQEPVETMVARARPSSHSAASSTDSSKVKPETASNGAQQAVAPPASAPAPASTQASVPVPSAHVTPGTKPALRNGLQPSPEPGTSEKASETVPGATAIADKPVVPPKPPTPPAPSPAHLLESKLRAELAGQPLAEKVKIQTTANALTLSGSLTLAEHKELFGHLRTVPAGVRVIDDTEYSEDPKAENAPAAPATTVGWIWVRSTPADARILVDGSETGMRTPARLELQPGEHEISLVHQGFETTHRTISVERGETMQFTETLSEE